jgi:hypothetical protein
MFMNCTKRIKMCYFFKKSSSVTVEVLAVVRMVMMFWL